METHHRYTGILLIVFVILAVLAAIFMTIAHGKVMTIDEYKTGNDKLHSAKNNLLIAYILAYVAAALGIILAILYFGHVAWSINNEIPHLIVFILLFALLVVSGVFGFLALSNIDSSGATDKQGSTGWIWAGLVSALVSVIVLIISGAWRAQHVASKASSKDTAAPVETVETHQYTTYTAPSEVNVAADPTIMDGPNYIPPPL
jgi:heme A synthase